MYLLCFFASIVGMEFANNISERGYDMDYISYMKKELVPAFGCTEPIALAYASAVAREILGIEPEKILVNVSGNIIKMPTL